MNNYKNKITIGLLIDCLTGIGGFQTQVWHGVSDYLEEKDINLISFAGGSVGYSPIAEYEEYRNLVYELARGEVLSGLILCGGTLGNYISREKFHTFCEKFSHIPIVSVGPAVSHIPSVQVDNKVGMEELLSHLIEHHGYREIAFISGSLGNADADERIEIYRSMLKKHNIGLDSDLIFEGDFNNHSGKEAVKKFIKTGKKIRVIVASNDNMALGALDELKRSNIDVPSEIAVTGFDNIDDSIAVIPTLTTISQPIYEQAQIAAKMILKMINGEAIEKLISVPTTTIIRRSCGCLIGENVNTTIKINTNKKEHSHISNIEIYTGNILNIIGNKKISEKLIVEFLTSLFRSISVEENSAYFISLNNLLNDFIDSGIELTIFQSVLSYLHNQIVNSPTFLDNIEQIESLFHKSRSTAAEMVLHLERNNIVKTREMSNMLMDIGRQLTTSFHIDKIVETLKSVSKTVDIPSIYYFMYKDQTRPLEAADIVLAIEDYNVIDTSETTGFQPINILPAAYLKRQKRFSTIIQPLYFQTEQLGYIAFEQGPKDGVLYESLFFQLSNAIKGANLVHFMEESKNEIKIQNEKITSLVMPMLEIIKLVSDLTIRHSELSEKVKLINEKSKNMAENTIKMVQDVSSNIDDVNQLTNNIDDISGQINVVALNASIQATHAGPYGRSFSVIAHEVRNLSDSTKKSSEEINTFLNKMNKNIVGLKNVSIESKGTFENLSKNSQVITEVLDKISIHMEVLSGSSQKILELIESEVPE